MTTAWTGGVARIVCVSLAVLFLCAVASPLARAAQTTYQYDELGRLKSVTSSDGSAVAYTYDAAGNRRSTVTTAATPGSIRLSASSYSGGEASGQRIVTVTVSRVGGSSGAATVNYATSNGSAISGSDYTAASGTLSWVNGDAANKTFAVTILDDAIVESSETINVTLSANTGAPLGSPSTAVISISDDEVAPAGTLQLSASGYSVGEGGTSATIAVTRTAGTAGAVGVTYATSNGTATAGSDYTATSGTLSWASGDATNKTFTIPIINDTAFEGNETLNIALSAPTGGATLGPISTATLTITDNDTAPTGSIQFSSSGYSVGEGGTSITITATRANGSFGAASANYATANGTAASGSDYTAASGTLNWASGDSASKTFSVAVLEDAAIEGSETFTVALSAVAGASLGSPGTATVTITDNDNPPAGTLQLAAPSYTVAETGGSVTITATRAGGSFGALSVNYGTSNGSAVSDSDYTAASGTLNWANGDASNKTIVVAITDDTVVEASETFHVSLASVVGALGAPTTAAITIIDNDMPTITIVDGGASQQGSSGATAFYQLSPTGDIIISASLPGGATRDAGDWLAPKTQMNRFEARATRTSGSHCTLNSPFDAWLNLGSAVTWTAVVGNTSALTTGTCGFRLEIRDAPTQVIMGSAMINLSVVDTPP